MKYLISICILLTSEIGIYAQISLQSYVDFGKNNVSEGLFIKNVYRSNYQYQNYTIEAGVQFDLVSPNPKILTGIDISCSRAFLIKDFPFALKGFFMLNRFSDLQHETNFGFRLETKKLQHFLFEMGTNFKTYTINSAAREEYNISRQNSKLSENFNLIYLATVYLKPHQNHWNVGLSLTNIDYYIINQSTNPVFYLQFRYGLRPKTIWYMDAWYKQAGIFNINANYFGYFFRGGIKIEL